MRLRPTLALLAVVSFVGGLACYAGRALLGNLGGSELGVFGTVGMILALHVVIAIGLLVAYERRKAPRLMIAGVALLVLAPVLWIMIVWGSDSFGRSLAPFAGLTTGWPLLIMIIGLVLSQPATRRSTRAVRLFTVIAAAVMIAALPVALFVALYLRVGEAFLARAMTAGAVLVVSGLFTGLVLGRLRELAEVPHDERPTIDLTCPRCGRKQTLVIDGDRCGRCGLGITVQVP